MKVKFGFSPCPNDTFMFWAWVHGQLSSELELAPQLADIQQLNRLALENEASEFTKISMGTYLHPGIRQQYRLLSSGAALGRGCGPLVVANQPLSDRSGLRLAIPGRDTTACRLAQMALGDQVQEWVELRYDEIMPAVLGQERVDAGVIIHESRFVYADLGLVCALDLGQWWEERTGLPLPLGLMVAHKDLSQKTVTEAEQNLRASIALAQEVIERDPGDRQCASLWEYLRANAIELDDQVMRSHIDLYVNDFSLDLGEEGRAAVAEFARLSGHGENFGQ